MKKLILLSLAVTAIIVQQSHAKMAKTFKHGGYTQFYTPAKYDYEYVRLRVLDRDTITFKVRACSDAHIMLSQDSGDIGWYLTEIVIGGWNNSLSAIKKPIDGTILVLAQTPNILHCYEYRQFWISWKYSLVAVGRGPLYGRQTIMTMPLPDDDDKVINDAAFSTGFGSAGSWRIDENMGYYTEIYSPQDVSFENVWKTVDNRNGVYFFEVTAASNVHIAMSPSIGLYRRRAYEIVIGAEKNTKTIIRDGVQNGKILRSSNTKNVLSGDSRRPFWVSWRRGYLAVGSGDLYWNNILCWYQIPGWVRPITALGFSTGSGNTGMWRFDEDLESKYILNTPPNGTYLPGWITTPVGDFFLLQIQACRDAVIILAPNPGDFDDMAIEIIIGAKGNTKTSIESLFNPGDLKTADTPDVLDCNIKRTFWFAWKTNIVEIGSGSVYGRLPLIDFDAGRTHFVNSIGFRTADGVKGQFVVRRNTGEVVFLQTTPDYGMKDMWLTVRPNYYRTFRVQAAKDAAIVLSEVIGRPDAQSYEVILGANNNQDLVIRDVRGNTILYNSPLDNRYKLAEDKSKPYWVGWQNGNINVGYGDIYFQNYITSVSVPNMRPTLALAVSTNNTYGGWTFYEDTGDIISVLTSKSKDFAFKWFQLKDGVKVLLITVQATENIHIALSDTHTSDANIYEVAIGEQGNKVSTIRKGKGGPIKLSANTADILNSNDVTNFYLMFNNGRIVVGKGHFPDPEKFRPFLDWQDTETAINVVSLGLSSPTTDAEWRIPIDKGMEVTYDTNWKNKADNEMWLTVGHRQQLVFSVRACADVMIRFATIFRYYEEEFSYYISLGNTENTKSSILVGPRKDKYVDIDTRRIIHCNSERPFWMSWYNGQINFGMGKEVGKMLIMAWQHVTRKEVNAISFTAVNNNRAFFRLNLNDDGPPRPPPTPSGGGLKPGEIAATVIGFLALFALFGLAIYVIFRPPAPVQKYLLPEGGQHRGPGSDAASGSGAGGFENPVLHVQEISTQPPTPTIETGDTSLA